MPLRLPDLVGRAMIDPEFLTDLRTSTESVLSGFELTDEEGVLVRRAIARLDRTPSPQQIDELKNALLRRVST